MSRAAGRVLVVDDDVVLREVLTEYLADAGFVVRTAANGREGLAVLGQWRPDLILLDQEMPGLDGPSFRARQLADASVAEILVLLYSARRDLATQAEVLQAAGVVRKGCSTSA
jgi:CheY-like chemotaxis protein